MALKRGPNSAPAQPRRVSRRVVNRENVAAIALAVKAIDRTPAPLEHVTTFHSDNLIKGSLNVILPGWDVYTSRAAFLGDCGFELDYRPVASWPTNDSDVRAVVEHLTRVGCNDGADLVGGHCEPMAVLLAEKLMECILRLDMSPSIVPNLAHEMALESLEGRAAGEAAGDLFRGNFMMGFDQQGHAQWGPDVWGRDFESLQYCDLVLGTQEAAEHIKRIAKRSQEKGGQIIKMPLYILNYLFTKEDKTEQIANMTRDNGEAMYDCHVVGLVFDGRKERKHIYVADPNGSLIPGSNMEFLVIPFQKRKGKPTTSVAEYETVYGVIRGSSGHK